MRLRSHDGAEKERIDTSLKLFASAWVHAYLRACVPAYLNLGVHCYSARVEDRCLRCPSSPPTLSETGFSRFGGSAHQASWPSRFLGFSGPCLLSLHRTTEAADAVHRTQLCTGSGDSNPGPQTHTTSPLPTEPSPQLPSVLYLRQRFTKAWNH